MFFQEGRDLNDRYRYLLLFLLSLSIIIPLFIQQKELDTTSYPENLFEERELSDASDIDVSGDQDYLLEEKTCDKVRSYSELSWSVSIYDPISCVICCNEYSPSWCQLLFWRTALFFQLISKLLPSLRMPKRPFLPGLEVTGKSNSRTKRRKHLFLKDFLSPTEYRWQRWVLCKIACRTGGLGPAQANLQKVNDSARRAPEVTRIRYIEILIPY